MSQMRETRARARCEQQDVNTDEDRDTDVYPGDASDDDQCVRMFDVWMYECMRVCVEE